MIGLPITSKYPTIHNRNYVILAIEVVFIAMNPNYTQTELELIFRLSGTNHLYRMVMALNMGVAIVAKTILISEPTNINNILLRIVCRIVPKQENGIRYQEIADWCKNELVGY